jgi:rod shape determining protein RodA
MIDRRIFKNFDWMILSVTLVISLIGIINLYSVTCPVGSSFAAPLFLKQVSWVFFGFILMIMTTLIDYHLLERFAYPVYGFSILLLALVPFFGKQTLGSQRWLQFGVFSFQPSELAKLALIITFAKYFCQDQNPDGYELKDLILPLSIVFVPFFLIVIEPDLGTSIMFVLISFSIFFFLKIRLSSLAILVTTVLVTSPFFWHLLKDYQKRRILTLFRPSLDPLGAGYHVTQSKIAVGSGGFLGKGFLEGTQSQLRFLPEQHTDFAFSVLAEEWGFLGSVALLLLLFFLILKGLDIAIHARDKLGTLLAFGIVAMLFWHIVINIGMVIGLFPVVGIPLPFISYGGSFMIINMVGIGLLMNINMRRFIF